MAKKTSDGITADKSVKFLRPEDFTYPDEGEKGEVSAKGQPNWASVRSRQSGIFDTKEELNKLKLELEEVKAKLAEELIIGGQ